MEDPSSKSEEDSRTSSSSQRHISPYKVGVPPKQKLWEEFSTTLKETFFSDDPLRSFKDQSRSRKCILGLQAVFPILEWGRTYDLSKFKGDVIAGLTIASLCIPQVFIRIVFVSMHVHTLYLLYQPCAGHWLCQACKSISRIWLM